ncbi:RNA polymerase sigma factor [Planctobacterium marinum]|uniref:RNA polymerase subunit sigma-24 n=1 Tax=Planctobacterium marinum TaxID=1631968 RepID=A0AA48HM35_9ALTE|nr:RNA polymerase subunit sigma-24 [Planctobacterium marinum]
MANNDTTTLSLEHLYRQYSQPILAYIMSLAQDLELAQEIWHETFLLAMQHWQTSPPENPPAWFKRTARNKFIDSYRHKKMATDKAVLIKALAVDDDIADEDMADIHYGDEQLKLIFTCCHPALDFDKQVALTLSIVAGLSTEQIAQALLLSQTTLEQRLTRAKRKIKQAAIPFVIPESRHLAERLNAVLKTLYLMFNAGVNQQSDPLDLAGNAMNLVKRLDSLLPYQAEVEGMLALMLFHQSRQSARYDSKHQIVPLSEQNRALWQASLIAEAERLLQRAMARQALGVYQIQAAIQGMHCHSTSWQSTDWAEIEALYRVHIALDNSPVVKLNSIYAISMSRNVAEAMRQLTVLEKSGALASYAPFYALQADLHQRAGDLKAAHASYLQAEAHSNHPQEQSHFCRQAEKIKQILAEQ